MIEQKAQIGVIGLAVMGANLARNLASRNIKTLVYNRSYERTEELLKNHAGEYLRGVRELKDFVEGLEKPRKILLMVQAGAAVDAVIESLLPFLEKDDIIIDGGNSAYIDTIRRSKNLLEKGIHFMGMGVSGGEEGALHGPSLMPGGTSEAWQILKPFLEAIAAKDFSGQPCVTHIGTDGAGHFVKMVHNGIEYAVMQLMAEAYDVLRKVYKYDAGKIAEIFEKLQKGKLNSFLFEIVVPVLKQKNDQSEGYLIDVILDKAGQKGTGAWTVIEALQRGIPLSAISEAVFARSSSAEKDLRVKLNTLYGEKGLKIDSALPNEEELISILEKSLFLGMILCYSEGMHLIKKTSKEQNWQINLAEICRIWQGGCIIRSELLKILTEIYKQNPKIEHLLEAYQIVKFFKEDFEVLQKFCLFAMANSVAIPCFLACLSSFENLTSVNSSANLIQGLRDFFGAHTFERTDQEGIHHFEWGK